MNELTDAHKQVLEENGIDWKKWLAKVKSALPYILAIAELLLSDSKPPMFKAGHACTHKEKLQHALHLQICATHDLCHAICECADDPVPPA